MLASTCTCHQNDSGQQNKQGHSPGGFRYKQKRCMSMHGMAKHETINLTGVN